MNTEHPLSMKIGYAFAMVIAGIIGAIPVILLAVLADRFIPAYHDYLQLSLIHI